MQSLNFDVLTSNEIVDVAVWSHSLESWAWHVKILFSILILRLPILILILILTCEDLDLNLDLDLWRSWSWSWSRSLKSWSCSWSWDLESWSWSWSWTFLSCYKTALIYPSPQLCRSSHKILCCRTLFCSFATILFPSLMATCSACSSRTAISRSSVSRRCLAASQLRCVSSDWRSSSNTRLSSACRLIRKKSRQTDRHCDISAEIIIIRKSVAGPVAGNSLPLDIRSAPTGWPKT